MKETKISTAAKVVTGNLSKERFIGFVSEVEKLADKYNIFLTMDSNIDDFSKLPNKIKANVTLQSLQESIDPVDAESTEAINILINNADRETKVELTKHYIGLDILAKDEDPGIRALVAYRIIKLHFITDDNTPNDNCRMILKQLVNDKDESVKISIATDLADIAKRGYYDDDNNTIDDQDVIKFKTYIHQLAMDSSRVKIKLINLEYIEDDFINDQDPRVLIKLLQYNIAYAKKMSADQMRKVTEYMKEFNKTIF